MSANPLNPNLVHLFPRVARAVEVAIAGNHTLQLIGETKAAEAIIQSQVACRLLTHERGNPRLPSPEMIVEAERAGDAREIVRLQALTGDPFTAWKDVRASIQELGELDTDLSPAAVAILDASMDRLNATLEQTLNCLEVARTIAALDCLPEALDYVRGDRSPAAGPYKIPVNAEHVAEATQYTMTQTENRKGGEDGNL